MIVLVRGLLHGQLVRRVRDDERADRLDARAATAADRRQLIRRRRARARPEQTNITIYFSWLY